MSNVAAIEQAIQFVYSQAQLVNDDGTAPPAQTYEALHRLGTAVDEVKKAILGAAMADVSSYGKGEHSIGMSVLSVRATGGKWDMSAVPGHKEAKEAVSLIEQRAKATYEAMKLGLGAHDRDTGEVLEGARYTPGGETIFVSKPKPTAQ